MGYSFEYIDIILLAMIAGFIFLRLRGILGKRTGFEGKNPSSFEKVLKDVKINKVSKTNDNFDLTEKLMNQNYKDNFLVLNGVNHKNTFDEPEHSIDAIINFLQT